MRLLSEILILVALIVVCKCDEGFPVYEGDHDASTDRSHSKASTVFKEGETLTKNTYAKLDRKESEEVIETNKMKSIVHATVRKNNQAAEPNQLLENIDHEATNKIDDVEDFPDQTKTESTERSETVKKTNQTASNEASNVGNNPEKSKITEDSKPTDSLGPVFLVICLGGGDDAAFAASTAQILKEAGNEVAVVRYEGTSGDTLWPPNIKTIDLEATPMKCASVPSSPPDSWLDERLLCSRLDACRALGLTEAEIARLQPAVIIVPLWLHDVCVLALARRLAAPVVGVLTSRVGSWWSLKQLGTVPDISSVTVPTGALLSNATTVDHAFNLATHYQYVNAVVKQWEEPAWDSLPQHWTRTSTSQLYGGLHSLMVTWHSILDYPSLPAAIPIAGLSALMEPFDKEPLVATLNSRAGVLVVDLGGAEQEVLYSHILEALHETISPLHYSVLWRTNNIPSTGNDDRSGKNVDEDNRKVAYQHRHNATVNAKFVYRRHLPLSSILGHPRLRLLISGCGDHDSAVALHYAAPLLCIPRTLDQRAASRAVVKLGVAVEVHEEVHHATSLTWEQHVSLVERLKSAIKTLTRDSSLRARTRGLAEDIHDSMSTPGDRLLFHVERVVRRPLSDRYRVYNSGLIMNDEESASYTALIAIGGVLGSCVVLGILYIIRVQKSKVVKKD